MYLWKSKRKNPWSQRKIRNEWFLAWKKTKFRRNATEDMESMSNVDQVMDSEALIIGEISISLNCSISLILPTIFKSKKTKEDVGQGGVTIESSEECKSQKVMLEKPFVEMTRHIKPLYVRAHLHC